MSWGRLLSATATIAAVAGAALVAVGMSHGNGQHPDSASASPFVMPTLTHVPYTAPEPPTPATTSAAAATKPPTPVATSTRLRPTHRAAPGTTAPRTTGPPPRTVAAPRAPVRTSSAAPKPAVRPAVRGGRLPLGFSTGSATRVITVVAHSSGSTTARLQAWTKAPGGGWLRHGSAVTAHIGSAGMSRHPSESISATPIGTFTLTAAFGYYGNPGTRLSYFRTTSADWWISQSGPLYNTHQRCSGRCPFRQGDPNEHLYYVRPQYSYAVVIDYNTRNSPTGVRQGAGSAFFLHVTDGSATAGCVAIPQSTLVSLMRWLTPTAHPRILIGVA